MKATYASQKTMGPAVLGLHTFKGIKVIHSSYLLYLKEIFDFVEEPLILHAVLYCHSPYLKEDITHHLQLRQTIKEKLKSATLSPDDPHKAELLYLDTNSCYWAVHHKNLANNVAPHMKNSYESKTKIPMLILLLYSYHRTHCAKNEYFWRKNV